jgi:hypothetical protein
LSHDIVVFKNSLLGNVFGEIPKSTMPETIDFTGFPKFLLEIFQKWESQKCFWENKKFVFGRIFDFWESLLGEFVFLGWYENCNKRQEVCAYAKNGIQR